MTAGRFEAMLHVFVDVVRSRHDHFAGLRAAIEREGLGDMVDVRFSPAEFDWIDEVEYSERRFLRMLYYRRIFRSLVDRLDAVIAAQRDGESVRVYFSDEGVWAVIWADYRRRLARSGVQGVNVQHGFALVRPARWMGLRRAVNAVSRLATGFACIGYGSLAGAGPEPFELYLTYDEAGAAHIRATSGRAAIVAPHLIKHQLVTEFARLPAACPDGPMRVLFAMNVKMRGSPIKCDVVETFDVLLPLAQALEKLDARLVIRFHPGMDQQVETRRFLAHPIARHAELDERASLQMALAGSGMVMSLLSTVLWEAGLLGILPVQIMCRCCDDVELGYARAQLRLDADFRPQLASLVATAQSADRSRALDQIDVEWRQVKAALLQLA